MKEAEEILSSHIDGFSVGKPSIHVKDYILKAMKEYAKEVLQAVRINAIHPLDSRHNYQSTTIVGGMYSYSLNITDLIKQIEQE